MIIPAEYDITEITFSENEPVVIGPRKVWCENGHNGLTPCGVNASVNKWTPYPMKNQPANIKFQSNLVKNTAMMNIAINPVVSEWTIPRCLVNMEVIWWAKGECLLIREWGESMSGTINPNK